MITPTSIAELREAVTAHDKVLAIGAGTKSRLCHEPGATMISTLGLSGITEYEPSEYTFTARAGTPVKEVHATVQSKGQFLPCSTLFRESGATLGGAIASGLSGAGRFRFGGLRDFLLGIEYISGEGTRIYSGGKVVKNAAGFDLSKFMVGSLGRYGILTEVTFKVFPRPSEIRTLAVQCKTHREAVERLVQASAGRWELHAIDYNPELKTLYLRLGGPGETIQPISVDIEKAWPGNVETVNGEQQFWHSNRELLWADAEDSIIKVPLSPSRIPDFQNAVEPIEGTRVRYSCGGNVAIVAAATRIAVSKIDELLNRQNLKGMTMIGPPETSLWLGKSSQSNIETNLKAALDPQGRFPSLYAG